MREVERQVRPRPGEATQLLRLRLCPGVEVRLVELSGRVALMVDSELPSIGEAHELPSLAICCRFPVAEDLLEREGARLGEPGGGRLLAVPAHLARHVMPRPAVDHIELGLNVAPDRRGQLVLDLVSELVDLIEPVAPLLRCGRVATSRICWKINRTKLKTALRSLMPRSSISSAIGRGRAASSACPRDDEAPSPGLGSRRRSRNRIVVLHPHPSASTDSTGWSFRWESTILSDWRG